MPDQRFPILGTNAPPMIGREKVMQRLWNDLTKASPSHLSIVGSRYSGKSVLLKALAERMRRRDSPYSTVILWDLGHQTPDADGTFIAQVCKKIRDVLRDIDSEKFSEHMELLNTEVYGALREVVEDLEGDKFKLLMLWDGFDKPLATGKLTRNLWDQLRELASCSSLRLVTATRRPLHELIRDQDSVTSDFWNIFDMNPLRVGTFDDVDRDAILAQVPEVTFNAGAKSELENWTGGYPPLYLAVINQIIDMCPSSGVDNQIVNQAAEKVLEGVSSILNDLWNDCPESTKSIYLHLVKHGEMIVSDVRRAERTYLDEKGFVKPTPFGRPIGLPRHIP